MGLLLCKPGAGVWAMADAEKQPERLPCPFSWPCMPCAGPGCIAVCCQQSRECICLERRTWHEICRMPCVPGICGMCFSACGRYLYQLSSEADSIHTRCVATGELLYAAPVGVFPRCMKAGDALLLCAGGAVNEAYLLDTPELTTARTITTRHPCFAADFWQDGLVLVCAAEGDDIRTVICTLPPKAIRPRVITELPGPPGTLCVCPDRCTALISTRVGLCRLDLKTGELMWNLPELAFCMRVECRGNDVLVSDTVDGSVCILHLQRPWEKRIVAQAADSQACFLAGRV